MMNCGDFFEHAKGQKGKRAKGQKGKRARKLNTYLI